MKLWRWESGRQGGGYSKLTLAFSERLKFDVYILRLPRGSMVSPHRDPSPEGFEHHRLNITLRSAARGGHTYFGTYIGALSARPKLAPKHYHFRPDLVEHFVTAILKGEVWLLSIGWLRKAK